MVFFKFSREKPTGTIIRMPRPSRSQVFLGRQPCLNGALVYNEHNFIAALFPISAELRIHCQLAND